MNKRTTFSAILLPVLLLLGVGMAHARELSFEDRVKAQEAIERVYYKHQIGAKVPIERAIPASVIEQKVRTVLRESAALKSLWHTTVTTSALEREIERMNLGTRMPARLREIHAALGNDPLLIRECLARPMLVDRLVRNFFAYDSRIHGRARAEAEDLHRRLGDGSLDPRDQEPHRILIDVVKEPSPDGGSVLEEKDGFQILVPLLRDDDHLRAARYWIPKITWEDWWRSVEQVLPGDVSVLEGSSSSLLPGTGETAMDPDGCPVDDVWENRSLDDLPDGRGQPQSVWTGSLLVVWGGLTSGGGGLVSGGRYDPATDTWSPTTTLGAPSQRYGSVSVWTGSRMIVWGGAYSGTNYDNGAVYDPVADRWTPTSTQNAPSRRTYAVAVWTGTEMVVWGGGTSSSSINTGGRYNPVTDTWVPTSTANAPPPRGQATAVWTGTQMIVWGGGNTSIINPGGRYDPAADQWSPVTTVNAPSPRRWHSAVWTGSRMVVWGGDNIIPLGDGGLYDPVADVWTPTSNVGAPSLREHHSAVWTGSRMIVWGGVSVPNGVDVNTGAEYDPVADNWTPTSTVNAPEGRDQHAAVWTGTLMIVWGGYRTFGGINTGGRYDPTTSTWTPTSTGSNPGAVYQHTAVWTGTLMIEWGGIGDTGTAVNRGARYDPALDTWSPVSAYVACAQHVSVWTGDRMIVWGGRGNVDSDLGGLYDPVANSWSAVSPANRPSARHGHKAVWTGSKMIVWGGADNAGNRLNTGGVYDVALNTWTATSLTNAPMARNAHTVVWTGNRMIVWGGNTSSPDRSGGLYDPASNTWTATSTMNAPSARYNHTAAWTGAVMVVWGGFGEDPNGEPGTGGRYDPVSNTWTPTSVLNAAIQSLQPSSVWTGTNMLVWSLRDGSGRYNPVTDTWRPLSSVDAPSNRSEHTVVWTGAQMILWGGLNGPLSSGGAYNADPDDDGDGYTVCEGDCEDNLSAVHPGASEICNTLDDDCNGSIDDGIPVPSGRPVLTESRSGGSAILAWPPVSGATHYDVVRGSLAALHDSLGDFSVSTTMCVGNDLIATTTEDLVIPAAGFGTWHLVRPVNYCSGNGSYDEDAPSQQGSRDAGIQASPVGCP